MLQEAWWGEKLPFRASVFSPLAFCFETVYPGLCNAYSFACLSVIIFTGVECAEGDMKGSPIATQICKVLPAKNNSNLWAMNGEDPDLPNEMWT